MKTNFSIAIVAAMFVAACPERPSETMMAALEAEEAAPFNTVSSTPDEGESDVAEADAADGDADAGPGAGDAGAEDAAPAPEVDTDIIPEGDAEVSPDEGAGTEAGTDNEVQPDEGGATPDEGPSGDASGPQSDEGGESGAGADEGVAADAGEELAEVNAPGSSFGCTSALQCDDGNVCTKDACENGACAYTLVSCLDSDACTDDICVSESGCIHAPFLESEVCDGGETAPAACVNGTCTAVVEAEPCVPDCVGKDCGANGCSGSCGACEAGTECMAGVCSPPPECSGAGDPVCNDGNQCTEDGCNGSKCTHTPLIASCDDGNACTTGETCQGGVCAGGQPITCTGANPCLDYKCGPQVGCFGEPKSDGTQCGEPGTNFVIACNAAAECVKTVSDAPPGGEEQPPGGGEEPGGEEPPPEPVCTTDADCPSDGNSCTDEVCGTDENGKATCLSVQLVCDDADPCTKDSCHGATAEPQCLFESVAEGDPCGATPEGETKICQAGVCEPIVAGCVPDCVGKSCGADGCGGDCGTCPDTSDCECAGAFIVCSGTTGDCTENGQCFGIENFTDCDDGNPCTLDDKCAEDVMGPFCSHEAEADDGVPCDDHNANTPHDECQGGVCTGFEVVSGGCVPECGTKKCGNNGCGGDCGKCAVNEVCFGGGVCESDADADGVADISDNCPAAPNPGQENADGDNYGDACDCGATDASVHPNADEVCGNGKDDDCEGGDAVCPIFPQPMPFTMTAWLGPDDYPYPDNWNAFCGAVKVFAMPCSGCNPSGESVAALESTPPVATMNLGTGKPEEGYPDIVDLAGSLVAAEKVLLSIRHGDGRKDGECFSETSWAGGGPGRSIPKIEIGGQKYVVGSPVKTSDGFIWVAQISP